MQYIQHRQNCSCITKTISAAFPWRQHYEVYIFSVCHELWVQSVSVQTADAAAVWGLVSGAGRGDTACPCCVTFLLSSALISGPEISRESDIAGGKVSGAFVVFAC